MIQLSSTFTLHIWVSIEVLFVKGKNKIIWKILHPFQFSQSIVEFLFAIIQFEVPMVNLQEN